MWFPSNTSGKLFFLLRTFFFKYRNELNCHLNGVLHMEPTKKFQFQPRIFNQFLVFYTQCVLLTLQLLKNNPSHSN